MPYVLPDSFLEDLQALCANYERRAKISLDTAVQPSVIACLLGAKNIEPRRQQIHFIKESLLSQHNLKFNLSFANEKENQEHIKSDRVLVAVCFFIKAQVNSRHSLLNQLLDKALGLDKQIIDEKTKACYLLEARDFMVESRQHRNIQFLNVLWHEFELFLTAECESLDKLYTNPSSFPITACLMPLFSNICQVIGNKTGVVLGDSLKHSTPMVEMRYAITVMLNSSVFFMIRPTSVGISMLLLSPTIANIITDTFTTVSLSYILENIMQALGKGVGFTIGMVLDLSLKLLQNSCHLVSTAWQDGSGYPKLTGFSLIDGSRIVDGIKLCVTNLDSPPPYEPAEDYEQVAFEMENTGVIFQIGKEKMTLPWGDPLIEELHQKFVAYQQAESAGAIVVEPSAPLLEEIQPGMQMCQ